MRIGLNLLYLLPGAIGGTATYAAGLIKGLVDIDAANQYVVFVNREAANWPLPMAPNLERVVCPVRAANRMARYVYEQLRLPHLLEQHHIDLIHSLGYVAPLWPGRPAVVTVPDLNYTAFGNNMSLYRRVSLTFFVGQAICRSDHVLTISDFAGREIQRAFGARAPHLTVTPLAGNPGLAVRPADGRGMAELERLGLRSPFIVAFSSSSPHKNIARLISAFTLARTRFGLDHQLVLVGHKPAGSWAQESAFVRFTGYLEEPLLAKVLEGGDFLVFPSMYEGFGLPVLEAMVAGLPVICSDCASLPEVAGDAALYFDPTSEADMAQMIVKVAQSPTLQEKLRQLGFENLKRYSWEQTARQTLEVYQTVLSDHQRPVGTHL